MTRQTLIALGAGLVSAVTFISVALGKAGLGVLLYLVISLPIFLVGLAMGWAAAAIAAVGATIVILLVGGPLAAGGFAVTQAAAPVLLTYLALLNRPGSGSGAVEWYPPGRLVIAAALIGAALSIVFMVVLGGTADAIKEKIAPLIQSMIEAQFGGTGAVPIPKEDIPKLVDVAVAILPAMSAIAIMGALLLNLWLAGRVTRASGQLTRDWPDLTQITFPRGTPLAFAAATGLGFLGGLPGMAGSAMSGALFLAYLLLGLAIIHHATRGASWRPFALWALYLALLFVNPTLLAIALIGLADAVWPLRRKERD
ncbi:MAG: DUF2232 domain-containing protein [Hyphomicrobium sp.]